MALPSYLEDTAKDFAKQSVATYSAPIETSTFTGGLDASGKRAAGPGITGANPFVAQMDPLQTQAQSLAQQGIGSYSPFLQAAQAICHPISASLAKCLIHGARHYRNKNLLLVSGGKCLATHYLINFSIRAVIV